MSIPLPPDQVTQKIQEAYVYAYPFPVMYYTQQAQTTVPVDTPNPPIQSAPLNVFCNMAGFPDPSFKTVVRPNFDTLYSSAWLDLSRGPLVLKLPDTKDRYYLMPILSAWTDVIASPGMRTNPTTPSSAAQDFLLIGPDWKGTAPPCFDDLHKVYIPTNMAWISGRTKAQDTPEDLAKVHELQAKYQLVPLDIYLQNPNGDYHPNMDVPVNPDYSTDKPSDIVSDLSQGMAEPFFTLFANMLVQNPPMEGDGEMVDDLKLLGIFPGQPVDWSGESLEIRNAIALGVQQGIQAIEDQSGKTDVNGWTYSTSGIGNYQPPGADHDNYLVRAQIALAGLGANLPEDAVYPASSATLNLKLDGKNNYTLQFTTKTPPPPNVAPVPPVNSAAFWSITVYDKDGYPLPNMKKYSINSGTLYYKNEPITIYIQQKQPGDLNLSNNWLPVADGPFTLTMRLYWPDKSVLNKTWIPPAIQVVSAAQAARKADAAA